MALTDEVLMPGADYQAICNAVRTLTGGTAPLKSGDIPTALAGVTPGGGEPPTLQEKAVTITENGTVEITGDEGYDGLSKVSVTTNVDGKEAVATFGDAEGTGCVIFLPDDSGVEIYTKCASIGMLDYPYSFWLTAITPSSPTVLAALDAFVARLVANPAKFNSIFPSDNDVIFMEKRYKCSRPSLSISSTPTWAFFTDMMRNTISGYSMRELPQFCYVKEYEGDATLLSGAKASYPFVWYPAIKNGKYQRGLMPNTPTGTMPRYATVYKEYGNIANAQDVYFVNAAEAFGIAYDFIAMINLSAPVIPVYSYGAQTLTKEAIKQLTGMVFSADVTLVEGWNAVFGSGAARPTTLDEIQALCEEQEWFFDDNIIGYYEMSDYEKSSFAPYFADSYERDGSKSFTITFNVICEDTTETT